MESHRVDCCNVAFTISSRVPLGMIGSVCWKSPPKTTVIPPKGRGSLRMSRRVRSTASGMYLSDRGCTLEHFNYQ
ncbi:hypothetical protein K474DRAFT_674255 [Panus rudis PR-1116 ss-1]|nr:hypothetical protein K474DRAFT_674255 [Panus rudis PR-1116 ss-1]